MNEATPPKSAPTLRDRFEQVFSLDLRSLALFRITVAAMLLGDVAFRLPEIVPLYSEGGLLPRQAALDVIGPGLYFSVHFLLRESLLGLGLLFGFQLFTALAMLVGARTRIATALSWYLLASVQVAENYHLHLGGDTYLRMMLLWGALLPLGHFWSVDAKRRQAARGGGTEPREPVRAYSWVTIALVCQFLTFYLVAGLHKNTPIWDNGEAVYYMLHREHLATMFTPLLLEQRWALAPLTYGTYWFEVLGPLLLVSPFHTAVLRTIGIAMFVVFHIGLGAFLDIGPYPLMSIAPLAALIPTRFWQAWWPRLRGQPAVPLSVADSAPAIGAPLAAQAFGALVLAYSLLYQLQEAHFISLPQPVVTAGGALRINQNYKMMKQIGPRSFWLVVDGRTADGRAVDPFHGAAVSLEKPDDIPASLRSFRWRRFILGSVAHVPSEERVRILHHAFAEYMCREWNATHTGGDRLERLATVRAYETVRLDGVDPPAYAVLWKHECGASLSRDAASMSMGS